MRWAFDAKRTRISPIRWALFAVGLVLVGCGPADQDPVRVLPPAIRAADLVQWLDEAGVDSTSIDWVAVDAEHDRYLESTLRNRIVARDRITLAHRPIDNGELTPGFESAGSMARIARASLAANREFWAQLVGEDHAFLNRLGSIVGLDHSISGYLISRRGLQRTSECFRRAGKKAEPVGRFIDPVTSVLTSWSSSDPRPTTAIIAWTNTVAPPLAQSADRWWIASQTLIVSNWQSNIRKTSAADKAEFEAEGAAIAQEVDANTKKTNAIRIEYLRAAMQALATQPSGLPEAPWQSARDEAIKSLTTIKEYGPTDAAFRSFKLVEEIPDATRAQAAQIEEAWRATHQQLVLKFADDVEPQVAAAKNAMTQLSRLSIKLKGSAAESLLKEKKQAQAAPIQPLYDASEDELFYEGVGTYRNWNRAGMVTPAPSRTMLRTIASLAELDPDHASEFVHDSLDLWRELMARENTRINDVEKKIQEAGSDITKDAEKFHRMLTTVLQECVVLPNQHAAELDRLIGESIADRTEAFGGKTEPATTLWRVLRTYPSIDYTSKYFHATKELKCFAAAGSGSLAVLATDSSLPQGTRDVLIALLMDNADELLARANATGAARSAAVIPLGKSILLHQDDRKQAEAALGRVVKEFAAVNNQWRSLEEHIIGEAAEMLNDNDALQLMHRRASLVELEILTGSETDFARDGERARSLAASLAGADGGELSRALDRDDLALVSAIRTASAADLIGQRSVAELTDLYVANEALSEQSMRRIDRAMRAVRDSAAAVCP